MAAGWDVRNATAKRLSERVRGGLHAGTLCDFDDGFVNDPVARSVRRTRT